MLLRLEAEAESINQKVSARALSSANDVVDGDGNEADGCRCRYIRKAHFLATTMRNTAATI